MTQYRKEARTLADDERINRRVEELRRSNMPLALARSVAHGRTSLSEAVERMARTDRVQRLMDAHGLSKGTATQVVLGQADLGSVLGSRRFHEHRQNNRDRSVVSVSQSERRSFVFSHVGGPSVTATVTASTAFDLKWTTQAGETQRVEKLRLKYALLSDQMKRFRKGLKRDKALAARHLSPSENPNERYGCSDRRLFKYLESGEALAIHLLDGDIIKGRLQWFGRYEFGLDVHGADLWVFRHAIFSLKGKK